MDIAPTYIILSKILKHIVDICKIKPNSYYIIGSYTIRKERELEGRPISDLDVIMAPDEFEKLRGLARLAGKIDMFTGNSGKTTERYSISIEKNGKEYPIEIFNLPESEGIPTNDLSMKELKEEGFSKDENGHLMFSPSTLLRWKRSMNRPKNQKDISILEKGLKEGGKRNISTRKRR